MSSFSHNVSIKLDPYPLNMSRFIVSDKIWFQENVLCYISNAVKHTPVNGEVTIRCLLIDDESKKFNQKQNNNVKHVLIEVEDTGIGLSPDKMDILFKPFSQAQFGAGGTGLGLYSLALRVKTLNGTYGFKSRIQGNGTIFYFSVPYVPDNDYDDDAASTPQKYTSNLFDAGLDRNIQNAEMHNVEASNVSLKRAYASFNYSSVPKHVLVVDDALPVLRIVSRGLKELGMEVETAMNGYDALSLMKSKQYACVLMDIHMPIMDGFESTRRIRAWEKENGDNYPKQFIICCSANDDEDIRRSATECGMDSFICKPFKTASIAALFK
jgi:CheY-like chemotaxis protein